MRLLMIVMTTLLLATFVSGYAAQADHAKLRKTAQGYYDDGNYKEALVLFKQLCLDVENDPHQTGSDFNQAWYSLRQLNRLNELDKFREQAIALHGKNWRFLLAAAHSFTGNRHQGTMIAGRFERGGHRGGAKYMNAVLRDRTRALQLMHQAMPLAEDDCLSEEVAQFYLSFGRMINHLNGQNQSWRLHTLTDLQTLPDYEPGYGYEYGRSAAWASVDAQGHPIFHRLPETWTSAKTDGERWRWILLRAAQLNPGLETRTLYLYATFLHRQFGVQTMAEYGPLLGWGRAVTGDQNKDAHAAAFAVHTLKDTETIARLATGVKRFTLPDEHNFIRLFEKIAGLRNQEYADDAAQHLARIYENRKMYKRAAGYWKKYEPYNSKAAKQRIAQIRGSWGKFEHSAPQPAHQVPTVEYRYRNAGHVSFKAHRIKVSRLLDDIKNYVRKKPKRLDWDRLTPNNIGWRLVRDNQTRYIDKKVAAWDLALTHDPRHWDRQVTVALPEALKKAGAYLLTARLKKGNTARIIIWVSDTAIVRKPLKNQGLYYVADTATGKPVKNMPVEFFGYRTHHISGTNQYRIRHMAQVLRTDSNGLILMDQEQLPQNYQWLVTAGDGVGRLAFLGFSSVWYAGRHERTYNRTKTLVMTDRPVYRPGQTMKFKLWVRQARYDLEETSVFSGRQFRVRIHNPRNEKVYSKTITADEFGGVSGEFELPEDAVLGRYGISHTSGGTFGGQTFRVEAYKKPEFEVKIAAPEVPVMLGEKITATISAGYYFGSPVTQATVRYKILRRVHDSRWYPRFYWDWSYGPGYWWFGYDYPWYPGWKMWGCQKPSWSWWPKTRPEKPEVVAEGETQIQKDGSVRITFDTALAKAVHPDSDHSYTIQAEVRDLSRRTIAASGQVLVARRPFKVYAWVDRGHYRVGDTVKADFKARTLDQKPVCGKGRLTLLKINYRNGQPRETQVQAWNLDTDAKGDARLQIQASGPGQYRLAYTVTNAKGYQIEGGYIFNVQGSDSHGADYKFAKIELIPDKTEYADGDIVRLMVNTDQKGATVLLFIRPCEGVYLPPRVLKITGKSTVQEIVVNKKDMPNFFVEALTIYGGKVHSEVREIIVPPEKRVLNVALAPSKKAYGPGENAGLKLALTDRSGNPFAGETVITVYDRSVEYISGGSNIPEIKAFFWKWRRHHRPRIESSLDRWFSNLLKKDETPMGSIGIFGRILVDEKSENDAHGINRPVARASGSRQIRKVQPLMAVAPAMMSAPQKTVSMDMAAPESKQTAGESDWVRPVVRTRFADTAFWAARISTDDRGTAQVNFKMPENLTSWKARVWALGHGTKVGQETIEVVTRKELILRLQAPRFFTETDEVVLSANVHNYLKKAEPVTVTLALEGGCLELMDAHPPEQTIIIEPDGEARIDWRVKVQKEGEAVIRMQAMGKADADAVQMKFPVHVHGMMKQVPKSGVLRPEQTAAKLTFNVPAQRRVAQSRLELRYSPTLAGAMVDALPYLASYPYGCTEQTLNRFLPTVITQKILGQMGLDLTDLKKQRSNLNAQEIGDARERAAQWKRYEETPVFDNDNVEKMVAAGIKRLSSMQLSDGGWGWFSGHGERSYPHTTAVVVHGLQTARESGVPVPGDVIRNGMKWLENYQNRELDRLERWARTKKQGKHHADNLDALVYMVLVDGDTDQPAMRDFLYRDRTGLAVYAKAMFGIALHKLGDIGRRNMIIRNIEQYLVEDDENQTAWLNLPNSGYWWYWYGSEYEAHGYYLKLLALTAPKSRKAARLVKYLLNNRKHATYWNSTRDTAVIVEAFAQYITASGEAEPDMKLDIYYDGRHLKTVKINKQNLFGFDNKLVLTGTDIATGAHRVEIRKTGKGPLYFNACLNYFTLEDRITREGLEVKVRRRIFRLKKSDKTIQSSDYRGQAVDKKVEKYHRELLNNMAGIKSGDLVEVELIIESKNDYEYLVFEDMKAAGFEPVQVKSGYTDNEINAYVQFRDRKVCFFVRKLARGRHSVSYRLRAEIPGRFSAMPALGYAMYAPELKTNSDEIELRVYD